MRLDKSPGPSVELCMEERDGFVFSNQQRRPHAGPDTFDRLQALPAVSRPRRPPAEGGKGTGPRTRFVSGLDTERRTACSAASFEIRRKGKELRGGYSVGQGPATGR